MIFAHESAGTLRRLADVFASGRLNTPLSAFALKRAAPCSNEFAAEVLRLSNEGMSPQHLALLLSAAADAAEARASQAGAELVWTGPEVPGTSSRDTAIVVPELWRSAQRDVLVSTFVVHDVATVFLPLAQRMDEVPDLRVRIFLHINRNHRDTVLDSELLREFADQFRRAWPGAPRQGSGRPEVYYDPRGLSTDPATRATWHAKCVVVDDELSFVTSANFTEWAHQRNAEAGVLVRSRLFNAQLRQQFDSLVRAKLVQRLPGL
jgi:phosphatidylserine/phosphatidylglycerophosphate/cardiolipin synthase-like enzyme